VAKKKGLGANAFFANPEPGDEPKAAVKSTAIVKEEQGEKEPLRTVKLRESLIQRLELVKQKERPRLKRTYGRASIQALIEEAIDGYLKSHEK
jgi:hypothetical protein